MTVSRQLRADIARFITDGVGDFDTLALRLFRHQVVHNPDYRAIVGERAVASVAEIPCVPVALWRDLPLVSFPVSQSQLVFRTSGTTGPRGMVHRLDTHLYDLGARRFAEAVAGPIPADGVSLVPDATDSSLGHMCRTFSPELSARFSGAHGVDVAGAWADLRAFSACGTPVFVPGTALALAALVGAADGPVSLAAGSVVMVTGGFKGQVASVSAATLRSELVRLLPGAKVVEEYGMTELSSQMWADGPAQPFQVPPWMRVQVVDPWTGAPARRGLLRFIDLANVDTVLAIETRDEGTLLDDGRLILHGRLAGAPPRGCSLTVEEAMGLQVAPDVEGVEPPLPRVVGRQDPLDRARAQQVVHALARLPDARVEWGQGLTLEAVEAELAHAVGALSADRLVDELSTVPAKARPDSVAIVAAEGVFTAALEWVALCLAAGMAVRWKPPTRWPAFARAVGRVLEATGLPVVVDPGRYLGDPEVVVVFGSDTGILRVQQDWPRARVVGYGHRFGLAMVTGAPTPEVVHALVTDHTRFDTRGCMAPAGVFVVDGPLDAWRDAVSLELGRRAGPGEVAAGLGPEWRRRVALGRATLGVSEGQDCAVVGVHAEHWVPSALPWMVSLVPVSRARLPEVLAPHAARISVLARPPTLASLVDPLVDRTCRVGQMQSPPFPRRHDGQPMLARVCAWRG